MLILLSPAKKLAKTPVAYNKGTLPLLHEKTVELIKLLRQLSVSELGQLMHLSPALSELNYQRFQDFKTNESDILAQSPAILLFQGDVYQNLKADSWSEKSLAYAQSHLRILSGLYGLLRPLDLIQAYRLEMGTRLANSCGSTLYAFWSEVVTQELNTYLLQQKHPVLINLASTEYSKTIDLKQLKASLVTLHFKEQHAGQLRTVGILAKKARGAMARHLILHEVRALEEIKTISVLNYRYCDRSSNENNLTFIR